MLNHTWRIVLMVIALVFVLFDFGFGYSQWIAGIALIILLVGEFTCKECRVAKNTISEAMPGAGLDRSSTAGASMDSTVKASSTKAKKK